MIRIPIVLSMGFCLVLMQSASAFADAGAQGPGGLHSPIVEPLPIPDPPKVLPPETVDEAFGIGKQIVAAAKQGHWALMIGFVVMLFTALVNRILKSKIPSAVLPWLAIALGLVGQGAFALHYSGNWLSAIAAGVTAGMTAGGSYSAFGKYLPLIGKKKI